MNYFRFFLLVLVSIFSRIAFADYNQPNLEKIKLYTSFDAFRASDNPMPITWRTTVSLVINGQAVKGFNEGSVSSKQSYILLDRTFNLQSISFASFYLYTETASYNCTADAMPLTVQNEAKIHFVCQYDNIHE